MKVLIVVSVIMAYFQPNAAIPSFSPPVVQLPAINETSPPGIFLYDFDAKETETSKLPLTYSLQAKAQQWFKINNVTGETTVIKTIDREAMSPNGHFAFFVYATNRASKQGEVKAILPINDVNEPPVLTNLPNTVSVSEDTPTGQTVFSITHKDEDDGKNSQTSFFIKNGNEGGTFGIDRKGGKIILAKPLDYDTGIRQFTLNITANNSEVQPFLTASAVLVINVTNVNDLGFKFSQNVYKGQVLKDSVKGTSVTTVQAKDLDELNEEPLYILYPEMNPDNAFAINNRTGEVTVNGPIGTGDHVILVQAISERFGVAIALVNVSVVAVLSKPFQVDVIEGQANIDILNLTSTESSFSTSGATFTIESGNHGNHFTIQSNTNLYVGSQPLDRETRPEYTLSIKLTKNSVVKGLAMVTIQVQDINDNSPSFQQPYNVTVKEDIDIGSEVVQVTAVDPDQGLNGTVRYRIISGNDQGLFSINNITGQITLEAHLDRENIILHNLTVQASDSGSPSRTTTTHVIIIVEDVNDNSPVISPHLIKAQVPEDASDGFVVADIKAADADIGSNSKITYSIMSGADGHFTINSESGKITKTGALSYKLRPIYTVFVEAKDNGISPRSTNVVVNVNVILSAINSHAPSFVSSSYLGGIYKDTSDLSLVLTVSAIDGDTGSNGEVEYHLSESNTGGLFFMESKTGQLKTLGSFIQREGEKYNLSSLANDKGSSPKVSDPRAIINILVLQDSHSVLITSDVKRETLLNSLEEFKSVLDDLTDGKAFVKSIRSGNDVNRTLVIFNVVDSFSIEEKTFSEVTQTLSTEMKQDLITGKYKKWKIAYGEPPKTSARVDDREGLTAIVGAMICLCLLIGVGGIVMIVILLKKRREKERVRRAARVKFDDKPQYIEPAALDNSGEGNTVENAQEAQEVIVHMSDETSSIASEDAQMSPQVYNYTNEGYYEDNIDNEKEIDGDDGSFFMDGDEVNFGTFFPPPPTQPPPPIPETCESSLHSDDGSITSAEQGEDIPFEDDGQEYMSTVLPPHEDFADVNHADYEMPFNESPTHSTTGSTTHLVDHASSYQNSLLHDPSFGFGGALRATINKNLTTEL